MYVLCTVHEKSSYFQASISRRRLSRKFEFFIKVSLGEIFTYANFEIKIQKYEYFEKLEP